MGSPLPSTHTLVFLGLRGFCAKTGPVPGKLGSLVPLDHSHLPFTPHSQPRLHLLFRGRSSGNWGNLRPLLSVIPLLRAHSPRLRAQGSGTLQNHSFPGVGGTFDHQEHSRPQMRAP